MFKMGILQIKKQHQFPDWFYASDKRSISVVSIIE